MLDKKFPNLLLGNKQMYNIDIDRYKQMDRQIVKETDRQTDRQIDKKKTKIIRYTRIK